MVPMGFFIPLVLENPNYFDPMVQEKESVLLSGQSSTHARGSLGNSGEPMDISVGFPEPIVEHLQITMTMHA